MVGEQAVVAAPVVAQVEWEVATGRAAPVVTAAGLAAAEVSVAEMVVVVGLAAVCRATRSRSRCIDLSPSYSRRRGPRNRS